MERDPQLMAMNAGLCATCRHSRVVEGANSSFWLCELSRTDPRFPRYPRLPVLRCDGFQPQQQDGRAAPDLSI
jgi:hypothetical protein